MENKSKKDLKREAQNKVAERMRLIRTEMGLSQVELLAAMGCDVKNLQGWYSRAERGQYPMKQKLINAAEELFLTYTYKRQIELADEIRRLRSLRPF